MIEANVKLFAKLAAVGGEPITSELRSQKRAIRTDNDEKHWLQHLVLRSPTHLYLDSSSRFALGDYKQSLYLIAIGVNVVAPPAELQPVPLNAGVFTAIASELDVPILRTTDLEKSLFQYVFYPVEGSYELLDLDVIAPYFQRVSLFLVEPNSGIALDREFGFRAAIAATLSAPDAQSLAWPETTLERLSFMVRDPNERAPFHLLLRALTETRHDAAFMALYRCVEQLFPFPAISNLSAELGLSKSALGIAAAIEKHLGWRRREEDAIAELFDKLDSELIERMFAALSPNIPHERTSRLLSRRVYELRNQCVHFRPVHAVGETVPVENWPALTDLMLEAVQSLYATYSTAIEGSK